MTVLPSPTSLTDTLQMFRRITGFLSSLATFFYCLFYNQTIGFQDL